LGRFIIWTEPAFSALDAVYGTFRAESKHKTGYKLPTPLVSNPDISRIINSAEVQSALRPANPAQTPAAKVKRNPLRSLSVMSRLNPYAKHARACEAARVKKTRKGKGGASKAFVASLRQDS
jgi:large subunit ribosomal protein L4e